MGVVMRMRAAIIFVSIGLVYVILAVSQKKMFEQVPGEAYVPDVNFNGMNVRQTVATAQKVNAFNEAVRGPPRQQSIEDDEPASQV